MVTREQVERAVGHYQAIQRESLEQELPTWGPDDPLAVLLALAKAVLAQRPASEKETNAAGWNDLGNTYSEPVERRAYGRGFAAGAASRLLLTPPVEVSVVDTPGGGQGGG